MRAILLLIPIGIPGGCALERTSAPAHAQGAAEATALPVATMTVEQAQQLGYRIVNENGETLRQLAAQKLRAGTRPGQSW